MLSHGESGSLQAATHTIIILAGLHWPSRSAMSRAGPRHAQLVKGFIIWRCHYLDLESDNYCLKCLAEDWRNG